MSGGHSVIHIGVPKAASTTLQHSLFDLSDDLAEQGFYYPTDIQPFAKQHSQIALCMQKSPNREKYGAAIASVLTGRAGRKLLLSGEEFSLLRPEHIKTLQSDLSSVGEFRVVLYVRNLYRTALSNIAEISKKGKFVAYPASVLSRIEKRKSQQLSTVVSDWEREFGEENVIVECLEALPAGIVDHFASVAGIEVPSGFTLPDKNQSADPVASALLSHIAYEYNIEPGRFYGAYFATFPDRLTFPRLEQNLLDIAKEWVAAADLSHPKLARYSDILTARPKSTGSAPDSGEYLRKLASILQRTAKAIEAQRG